MNDLTKLPNIGAILAGDLMAAGIADAQTFKKMGAKKAFLALKMDDPGACFNKLCALEGAIEGIRWHHLTPEKKAELKAFLNSL
jgi:DNA transformation protein